MSKKDFRRHGNDKNRFDQYEGVANSNSAGSPTAADFAEEFEQLTASLKNASANTGDSEEPDDFEEDGDSAFSFSAILRKSGKICAFPFPMIWKGMKFSASFSASKIYSCSGLALALFKKIGSLFVLKGSFGGETESQEMAVSQNNAAQSTEPKSTASVSATPAVKTADKAKPAAEDDDEECTAPQWMGWVFKVAAVIAVMLLSVSGYFGIKTLMKSESKADNPSETAVTAAAPASPLPAVQEKKEIKNDLKPAETAKKEQPKPPVEKPAEKDIAKQEPKKDTKPAEKIAPQPTPPSAPKPDLTVFNPPKSSPAVAAPALGSSAPNGDPWAAPAPPKSTPEPAPADSPWALPPIPATVKTDTAKPDAAKPNTLADKEFKKEPVKETAADKTPPKPAAKPEPKPEAKLEVKPEIAAAPAKSSNETVRPVAMMPLESEPMGDPLARKMSPVADAGSGKIASSPLQSLSAEGKAPNIVSKKESALDIPSSETVRPLVQAPVVQTPAPRAPLENQESKPVNPFFGDTIKPLAPPKEMKPDLPLLIPDEKPLVASQPIVKRTPAVSAAASEPALEIPKETAGSPASVFQSQTPQNAVLQNTASQNAGQNTAGKQGAAVFASQPKQQTSLMAATLADKVPTADNTGRTGEAALGSSLQNHLKDLRSSSDEEPALNFRNKNMAAAENNLQRNAPLSNMPQNPNSAEENPLLKLVPTGKQAENVAEIKQSLPSETTAPQPLLAEVNPGYRRSLDTARPAVLQIAAAGNIAANTTGVLREGGQVYIDRIDEQIKRSPAETERYTIQPGDTYMTISDMKFGTSLLYRALAAHNRRLGIDYVPAPGTIVEIPTAEFLKTNYTEVLSRGSYRKEAQQNSGFRRLSAVSPAVNQLQSGTSAQRYTVQQNDNVFKIAMNELGDTSRWREILALNSDRIADPRTLQPGTEILLPNQSAARTASRNRGVY